MVPIPTFFSHVM